MKNYVVILLGFFLAAPMLGCSKDDTTSPKVGIIYKSGDNDDKNQTSEANGRSPLPLMIFPDRSISILRLQRRLLQIL